MEINEIIIYMIYICHYIERRNLNTKGEPEGIKTVRECNTKGVKLILSEIYSAREEN